MSKFIKGEMQMMKNLKFHKIVMATKRKWIPALPTIFVSIFLFLTILPLFGIQYVIMCSFLALFFRTRHLQDFRPRVLVKTGITMLLVCFFAFLATRNLALCIVLNFFVPFFIAGLLTNKFNPKAYFVYGMEFVFLQLMPINSDQLPTQALCLIYGYTIVVFSLYLYSRLIKRKRHYGTVRKGMKTLSIQFKKLINNEDFQTEISSLSQMMYHMNHVIYSSRNYNYLATGYGKVNYYFMLIFQRFHYIFHNFSREELFKTDEDYAYFQTLSELFLCIEKNLNQEDNDDLIQSLNQFMEEHTLSSSKANEAMQECLSILNYALFTITLVSNERPEKDWKVPASSNPIKNIRLLFSLDRFQIRFALRLAVVLCISFAFSYGTGFNHSYWYPMSAFLMLMPYSEESTMKINNRILGTIAGLCIVFFLMGIFKSFASHLIIIIIMTCFMYAAPITSWTMTMYTTCYGMALTTLALDRKEAILLRLLYVALAAITTWLANHFLLPNTAESEFKNSVRSLFDIDIKLIRELQKWKTKEVDMDVFRNLIVHSHLISNEIQSYINTHLTKEEQDFYSQLLPLNQKLISEMEQLNSYLRHHKELIDFTDNLLLEQLFSNLEDATKRICFSYTSNQLTSFVMPTKNLHTYGTLDDNLYFNNLAFNCIKSIEELTNLSTKAPLQELQR